MKTFILITFSLFVNLGFAASEGFVGNAGDPCEQRILEIASDIQKWINTDGHKDQDFKFKPGHNEKIYGAVMSGALTDSLVSCTSEIKYFGSSEKVCRNFEDKQGIHRIVCNRQSFLALNEKTQYKFTHHEYAGVAGLEQNKGREQSNYFYSDQITARLKDHVVKKLSILGSGTHDVLAIDGLPSVTLGHVRSQVFKFCRFKIQHQFDYKTTHHACFKVREGAPTYLRSRAVLELERESGQRLNLFLGEIMDGEGTWYNMENTVEALKMNNEAHFASTLVTHTLSGPGRIHCQQNNLHLYDPLDHADLMSFAKEGERVHLTPGESAKKGFSRSEYNICRRSLGLNEKTE